jgi:hypothetical protein
MKHNRKSLAVSVIIVTLLVSLSGPLADWVFPYYNVAYANPPGYTGVLIVAASGGDYTSVNSAVNSISGPGSNNRWLVWVAPGTYNEPVTMRSYVDIEGAGEGLTIIKWTGGSTITKGATVTGTTNSELRFLTIESAASGNTAYAVGLYNSSASPHLTHVSVAASGGSSTDVYGIYDTTASPVLTDVTITASGGTGNGGTRGLYHESGTLTYTKGSITVTGASGKDARGLDSASAATSGGTLTEVRISVEGGSAPGGMGTNYAYGVYNASGTLALNYVTVAASGSSNSVYGIYTSGAATFTDVGVTATGSSYHTAYGVYNDAAATLTNVTASVSAADTNYAVYNNAAATLVNVTATATSASSTTAYGVYNNAVDPALTSLTAKVTGGGANNYGVYNYHTTSALLISNSVISASGATTNYGVYNDATGSSSTTSIRNSQVKGDSTKAVFSVASGSPTVNIGGSLIDSGTKRSTPNTGNWYCAGVYDGSYVLYAYNNQTCP